MTETSEQLRVFYESAVKLNPSNIEAVHYLAMWHMERHSFQQARKYCGHLATLKSNDSNVWICLSICCAMAEEFDECNGAIRRASSLLENHENDLRIQFCKALLCEKSKDYITAMDNYMKCLNQSLFSYQSLEDRKNTELQLQSIDKTTISLIPHWTDKPKAFLQEMKGEIMLRICMLKKEMGAIDQAMSMCNSLLEDTISDSIRSNALCIKGLLHEIQSEFPDSEVAYRSALNLLPGHSIALERLGRVYLRYRETIPAAVQCFFKSVETNPTNHTSWYLLGRCYMATAQYNDACEAYNRSINISPNDAQVWCSLGVLYYAFGQYREALGMLARALKLNPKMADAWYNVGALYDMCDQPDDAQLAYKKASETGLSERFTSSGLSSPSLAQRQCWPAILNGANVLCIATTGSGKTLAYAMPMIPHINNRMKTSKCKVFDTAAPFGLVLVPTRELAIQVNSVMKSLKKYSKINSIAIYGGEDKDKQLDQLSNAAGVQLIVATPGFREQITAISNQIDRNRQTMLFSATFPGKLREIVNDWLIEAVTIRCNTIDLSTNQDNNTSTSNVIINDEINDTIPPNDDLNNGHTSSDDKTTSIPIHSSLYTVSSTVEQHVHVCSTHKKPRQVIN
eukprot:gene18192-23853_t